MSDRTADWTRRKFLLAGGVAAAGATASIVPGARAQTPPTSAGSPDLTPLSYYDVMTYKATGDGATDDTTAIQAALDACRSDGGGVVYLPRGTYLVTDDLIVGSNTVVQGASREGSILKRSSTASTVAVLKNYDRTGHTDTDIRIEAVTVYRAGEAAAANDPLDNTIQLVGVTRASVFNCRVRGGGKAIHMYGCVDWHVTGNHVDSFVDNAIAANPSPSSANTTGCGRIEANHCSPPAASGFSLGSSSILCTQSGVVIAHNTVRDAGTNAIECGYNGAPLSFVNVIGNVFKHSGAADVDNSILFTDRSDDCLVEGNLIERGTVQFVTQSPATDFNNRISIVGNRITTGNIALKQTKTGLIQGNLVKGGQISISTCQDVLVATNTVHGSFACGIWCVGNAGGAFVNNRIRVIGNTVFDCTTGPSHAAIMLDGGDEIQMILNRCYDSGVGVQSHGLYINATKNVVDFLNDFSGNTGAERRAPTTSPTLASGHGAALGFFAAPPVAQPSSTGETAGFTSGWGQLVKADSTFTGNVGSTAYRISDIVKHLKNLGLIAR